MRFATRLFAGMSLLVALTVVAVVVTTDRTLRRSLETEVAMGLEREARLAAALLPPDSAAWPGAARDLGRRLGRRFTLIDSAGRVRGDTEFDRLSLPRLENHAGRPEVQAAAATGVGVAFRRSASTNERQMYVAVRGGPPGGRGGGLAVVRVSASLADVDRQVHAVQRAVAWTGLLAVLAAALLAWPLAGALGRPLAQLNVAARRIMEGGDPEFPDSRVPEIATHIVALRSMARELSLRFDALRHEREEARTLVESMADGVLATDAEGAVITCNAAARRLLGYERAAGLPPLGELFHDKRARDFVREARSTDVEPSPVELRIEGRDLLASAHRLPTGGLALVLRDMTALRRLEAVRRDFVANVSHELKTPLTSIAGYAETLAQEPALDEQAQRFAATIVSNAGRMQRLVDDLLDLSRIESGGWRPERQVVELEPVAREVWSLLAPRANGLRFETDIPQTARALLADPESLRLILTNLLDNAVRHTPQGGTIRVSAVPARNGVTVAVSDTGMGISAEHLPRIFERFYRVDPSRSREHGGTGLGLAIVKHLVEAHGGRVEAESKVGKGTVVRMTFPA